ncbi:unnamed protein product [Brachionus calyciflorus]|uniref:Ubiquitin-like protease family profile domain-containing protein n=1 Tax=Brachionus calyciflorus TaxID=104777 RepID=A0A813MBE1_9BILA|nr:unnamed protein product [Brachionus calyciflorus]
MPNITLNQSEHFEFRPFKIESTSTPFINQNKNKNLNHSKIQKLSSSLVHNTSKVGKISKRKNEKTTKKMSNFGNYQSYDLIEKEKFRELIKANLVNVNKNNNSNKYLEVTQLNKTLSFSPFPKIQDDMGDYKKILKAESLVEKYTNNGKISCGYSRKINLENVGTLKNFKNDKTLEPSIVELDLTKDDSNSSDKQIQNNSLIKKSAQKRPTTTTIQQIGNEENINSLSTFETISKVNRRLSEFEKKMNEKLNKSHSVLDIIIKSQSKPSALVLQEARYNQAKIQKLDREKIERDLAYNFSQKLHLEASKLAGIVYEEKDEEEVEEIEDEFPELGEEHETLIKNALVPHPQDEVLINGFGAGITRRDIQTLKGLNWLNDEIINFYMSLLCERSQNDQSLLKVHAFTTFFYPKLIKDGYSTLRRWTRKIDIFSHDLILIPVHLGLHWTLSCIDFSCKEVRYYDSMNGNNNDCLKALKNYIKEEYSDKKGGQFDFTNWNFFHVKDVPQQMNGSDCGMFTCKYAEFLSRGKTLFNFNQSHMPYFRKRMIWEIVNKKLL